MRRSSIRLAVTGLLVTSVFQAAVGTITPSPSTVTLTSTNPAAGPVSSTVTLTWTTSGGATAKTWNITVQANQSTLLNCSDIPTSAITVSCDSASVNNGGSGTCSGGFTLSSASPAQIAGGQQGSGTANYSVQLTYRFTDSWNYKASGAPSCSLTLTYVVTQN